MARSDFNKAASAKSNFSKFGEPPHTIAPKRFDSEQTPRNSAPTLPLERSLQKGPGKVNHEKGLRKGKPIGKVNQ